MPRCTLSAILLLAGCNQYEYFNVAGYEQAKYSNDADIIFVIDNSQSMIDEASALGLNFNVFIDTLTSEEGAQQVTDDLSDAVDNYISYVEERGRFIDYQLGITTTSVQYDGGPSDGVDPGEAGLLVGDPRIINKYDNNVGGKFRANLLCEATYWDDDEVPSDPSYVCGDPVELISQEYLDCECGFGEWEDQSGSGNEEPLEAALMAMCRSVSEPPEVCYDPLSPFTNADVGSNNDDDRFLLREEGTVVIVIVGDEGDNSRRMAQGETDPEVYLDAFNEFDRPVRLAVIGPSYDPDDGDFSCNSGGARDWAVIRLRELAEASGGFYNYLEQDGANGCELTDFAQHLNDLGDLLNNLLTAFQLQSIPDVGSILVYVDNVEVTMASEAELVSEDSSEYTGGWSYDSGQNAVVFWGDDIPDYNQDVRIYYRPLEGKPRDLPFTY